MLINLDQLRIELARHQMHLVDLAQIIGVPPTTLSSWLNGRHPGPNDLSTRIEKELGLELGSLTSDGNERATARPRSSRRRE